MSNAKEIVMVYQQALGKGDFADARKYLHDDLSFVGPFESFNRPEPYLEALGKLHHIIARVEPRKTFVDGDDVYLLYDMVTNTPAGTAFVCDGITCAGTRSAPCARSSMPGRSRQCSTGEMRYCGRGGPNGWPRNQNTSPRSSLGSSAIWRRTTTKSGSPRTRNGTRRPCRGRACNSSATPDRACKRSAPTSSRTRSRSADRCPASIATSDSHRIKALTKRRSGSTSGTRRRPGRRRWRPATISTCPQGRRWPIRASGIPTGRY